MKNILFVILFMFSLSVNAQVLTDHWKGFDHSLEFNTPTEITIPIGTNMVVGEYISFMDYKLSSFVRATIILIDGKYVEIYDHSESKFRTLIME